MPGIRRTGNGARNSDSLPGATHTNPCGLACSLATFAIRREVPTPIEQGKPVVEVISRGELVRRSERGTVQPLGPGQVDVCLINRSHLHDRRIFPPELLAIRSLHWP